MRTFLHFGMFGRRTTTDLIEGVIDSDARNVFMRGQCHSFALAMHRETGWPIVGFKDEEDYHDSPGHCAVFCPQLNEYVDVEGVGAKERRDESAARHGKTIKVIPIKPYKIGKLKDYLPIKAREARPFAKTVVKRIVAEHGQTVLQNGGDHGTNHQSDSGPIQREPQRGA